MENLPFCSIICSSNYGYNAPADNDLDAQIKQGRVVGSDHYAKPVGRDEIAARLNKMRDLELEKVQAYGKVY